MWFATILLNRPFISHWERSRASLAQQSAIDPFEICTCAANNICLVLEKYTYALVDLPCDLIFCIFIAATIHLRRYRRGGADAGQAQQYLQRCIQWLTILGKSWKSAEARQQLLKESESLASHFAMSVSLH
jgi:hypothetical protein